MRKKITTEVFIQKAKLKHGNKYNYSLVEYKGAKNKVKIICSKHGIFEQTPDKHYQYYGCKKCSNRYKPTNKDFILKSKKLHKNKYDYSKVKYINSQTKVIIICQEHGEFDQTPSSHLKNKSGCPECGFISRCNKARSNTKEFINKSIKVHGIKFNYGKVNYIGRGDKIIIICKTHGEFKQTPHNHLAGNGCPICRESKGEIMVSDYLNKNNIIFEPQKRFPECRNILPLPFDFYLPLLNTCIEYQGIQHFKPRSKFGGQIEFDKTKKRDLIKEVYCKKSNIKLIKISYKEDVGKILNYFLT